MINNRLPPVSSLTTALATAAAILPTTNSIPIVVGNHGSASQILVDDTATEITSSWRTTGAVIVDIDSDRDLDVVFANGVNEYNFAESNKVAINSVPSGDGTSSFQFNVDDASDLPGGWANSACVAAGDFNGDGRVDLVFGNAIAGREWTSKNTLLLSNGNGDGTWSFETPVDFILPSVSRTPYSPTSLAVVDIDGDGDLDILSGSNPGNVILYVNQLMNGWDGSPTALFVEDRSGTRVPAVANVMSIATGDLDGRNGVDIVFGTGIEYSSMAGIENQVLLNNGSGYFTGQPLPGHGDGIITRAVAVGDVNGDGHLDIVLGNCKYEDQYSGIVGAPNLLLLNDGSATFSVSELVGGELVTNAVALGDAKDRGQGFVDILIGNYGVENQKLVNDGSGSFTEYSLPGSFSDTRFIGLLFAQIESEKEPDLGTNEPIINESSSGCGGCEIIYINTPNDIEITCTFNSTVGIPTKAELIIGSCKDLGNREAEGEIETDGQVQDSVKFDSEITLEEKNSGAPFFKEFCLRGDLLKYDYLEDIMRSVFARKCAINATLTYEVESGFSVDNILIEEFVAQATDASATREEDVLAYRCNDDGSEASEDALSIGSVLNICVYSPKSDVTVEVSSLDLKFESAVLTSPITGSTPNFVTIVNAVSVTGKSDSVQMVKTLMTPVVFDTAEGEVIIASGTANLFYTSPRITPDTTSRRVLQDGESSVFRLDIGVAEYRDLPRIASMAPLGNGAKPRFLHFFLIFSVVAITSMFTLR